MFKKYLLIPLVALGLIFGNPLLSSRKRTKRTKRPRRTKRPATKKKVVVRTKRVVRRRGKRLETPTKQKLSPRMLPPGETLERKALDQEAIEQAPFLKETIREQAEMIEQLKQELREFRAARAVEGAEVEGASEIIKRLRTDVSNKVATIATLNREHAAGLKRVMMAMAEKVRERELREGQARRPRKARKPRRRTQRRRAVPPQAPGEASLEKRPFPRPRTDEEQAIFVEEEMLREEEKEMLREIKEEGPSLRRRKKLSPKEQRTIKGLREEKRPLLKRLGELKREKETSDTIDEKSRIESELFILQDQIKDIIFQQVAEEEEEGKRERVLISHEYQQKN